MSYLLRRGRIVLLVELTYGLTLNFIFTPMAASSTSRYFRTPGIATTVTSSPPTNFSPFPSSQTSLLFSHPMAFLAHFLHLTSFTAPYFCFSYPPTTGVVARKPPHFLQIQALV